MEKLGALRIRNNGKDELLKEMLRRDKFDTEFGMEDDVGYSEDFNGD